MNYGAPSFLPGWRRKLRFNIADVCLSYIKQKNTRVQKFFIKGKQLLVRQKLWDFLFVFVFFFMSAECIMRFSTSPSGCHPTWLILTSCFTLGKRRWLHMLLSAREFVSYSSLSPALACFFFNICPIPAILLFDRSMEQTCRVIE